MALVRTTSWDKDLRSCMVAIRSAYDTLRASERRVADFVLAHPDHVVSSSVTEVAEASGTSEATVMRFCRALGYRGFPEIKLVLARDLARHDGGAEPERPLVVTASVGAIAARVFESAVQALIDTMELQQASQLERAVDALASASRIIICGAGSVAAVAREAERKFQLIGLWALAYTDPQLQLIAVSQVDPRDVVFGISHSGNARHVLRAMEIGAERGATTIGLANYVGSPLSRLAAIPLHMAGPEIAIDGHSIASLLTAVGMVDVLFVAVALRQHAKSVEVLGRVMRASDDLDPLE